MAKAASQATIPEALRAALISDDETHSFIRRRKASVSKKLTLSNMERLFEQIDIAVYLSALSRNEDALKILEPITRSIEFGGNYNIWTPVGLAACWQARLKRLAGDTTGCNLALEPIREHPFEKVRQSAVAQRIAQLATNLDSASQDDSQRWACQDLARALLSLCFFSETGRAEFAHSSWYDVTQVEQIIQSGLDLLHKRLG